MKNKILVVAAHPDDEVLGCGASIAKWTKQGHIVNILILSQGLLSRDNLKNTNVKLNKLKLDAVKSSKILGVKRINFCDFPDNKMDSIGLLNIVKSIEKYVFKFKPNILVTHSNADLNIDHKITHQACITATRTQNNNPVKKILAFEIPSSTEWNFILDYKKFYPNYFENVSGFIKKKIKALNCYKSEIRKWPHPRSNKAVQSLANWRGATIGVNEAEAFMLVREFQD